ncbi:probable WRKY transcription factor 43 [Juglans microcarpa x Juglans regia]|uniref:probable WRKY transcription factor 43 n=1 Tax=Juglans microcarpa x Juglans regia TaxID=2249226 RepID=UPI001B7E4B10|nr:probable WRKY transcription factor 43 [Juglans microcarpa x Juglans regia]
MEGPPAYFHGNSTDRIKVGTNNQPLETTNKNIFEGGSRSSGYESKVKSGKKRDKVSRMHRYAFQTRSQVDILDDGYRWRKYGQKAVKNSKFPRSYYRCTHKGCNVKKQIQRLSKDEEIVVTTYEGMHIHPLENNAADSFEQIFRQIQTYAPP